MGFACMRKVGIFLKKIKRISVFVQRFRARAAIVSKITCII